MGSRGGEQGTARWCGGRRAVWGRCGDGGGGAASVGRQGKAPEGPAGGVRCWFLQRGWHHVGAPRRGWGVRDPPPAVCWGSRATARGAKAAAISKSPIYPEGVLLYLVAEGHPPSSHLCDDF